MGIWVTVAVTFKVAVNATAEQRVFVRRRCRQWTRTGYHRCHTEWRGHHPVPDSTSPQQQWSAPGAPGSHLAPGTKHQWKAVILWIVIRLKKSCVTIEWHGASRSMASGMRIVRWGSRWGSATMASPRWRWSGRHLPNDQHGPTAPMINTATAPTPASVSVNVAFYESKLTINQAVSELVSARHQE